MTNEAGKGDKRRPGTGFADGWERVFGKAPEPEQEPEDDDQNESEDE